MHCKGISWWAKVTPLKRTARTVKINLSPENIIFGCSTSATRKYNPTHLGLLGGTFPNATWACPVEQWEDTASILGRPVRSLWTCSEIRNGDSWQPCWVYHICPPNGGNSNFCEYRGVRVLSLAGSPYEKSSFLPGNGQSRKLLCSLFVFCKAIRHESGVEVSKNSCLSCFPFLNSD